MENTSLYTFSNFFDDVYLLRKSKTSSQLKRHYRDVLGVIEYHSMLHNITNKEYLIFQFWLDYLMQDLIDGVIKDD